MAKNRPARKESRTTRVERSFSPPQPLLPKNPTQREYIQAIADSPIVIATGYPGTGKTYIPARIAGNLFNRSRISNIVLSRPSVSTSKSLGFFKGSKNEKMLNWLAPIIGALKEEFPPAELEYMMKEEVEQLTFCPLETIKGLSWKNSFIIIDEAEDLTIKEIRSILTRIGTHATIVLCGDLVQTDLRNSGLNTLIKILAADPKMKNVIEHIHFGNAEEIVRSPTCRELVLGFERASKYFELAA